MNVERAEEREIFLTVAAAIRQPLPPRDKRGIAVLRRIQHFVSVISPLSKLGMSFFSSSFRKRCERCVRANFSHGISNLTLLLSLFGAREIRERDSSCCWIAPIRSSLNPWQTLPFVRKTNARTPCTLKGRQLEGDDDGDGARRRPLRPDNAISLSRHARPPIRVY